MAASTLHATSSPRTFRANHFAHEIVDVDDSFFDRCHFEDCQLVFSGGHPPAFFRCTFEGCKWKFEGASANTLEYLSILFMTLPPEQKSLIDAVMESIRRGTVNTTVLTNAVP